MFKKLFSFFAALTLSVGLWAANSVITFTSTGKLYPGDINELMDDFLDGDGAKWAAFKAQYPEFADIDPMELEMMGVSFFNPNTFLDANGQVLNYTYNYDNATKTGTITFAGELVTIKDGVNVYAGAFYACPLTSITLPEGLTSIGEYSFRFCSSLASVTFPESLTTIVASAFADCTSLTSITIPANVTEIGYGAFMDCYGLTDFYVDWTTTLPTIEERLFMGAPIGTATLHVPVGSLELYQNADQWKNFGTFVEYNPLPNIKPAAIAEINAAIDGVTDEAILAIATTAITNINNATTKEEVNTIKTQALADIAAAIFAKYKADAIAAVDAAVAGVTDESILAIATTAKTNIGTATTVGGVDAIKAQALADIAAAIFAKYKNDAIAEIQTAGQGIQNTNLNNWINGAITDINAAGTDTKEKVDNIKNQILPMIQLFQDGKAEAKAELLGDMATPCTNCTAVEVTDGTTTVTLYKPTNVGYIKK